MNAIGLKLIGWRPLHFSSTRDERNAACRSDANYAIRPAMPDARMLGRTHMMRRRGYDSGYVVKESIVWDTPNKRFALRHDQFFQRTWGDSYSYEEFLPHQAVLSDSFVAGAVVDQEHSRIYLPDGRWIDGPTGQVYTVHGEPLAKLSQQAAKEL